MCSFWVPLFHCKTKTHFEGTWRVDELPPEAEFFREAACGKDEQIRFCLEEGGRKTKKTLSQKRRKERKSKL